MPDQLQLRGGTTVQHSTFTGASKEVTVDTTKKTAVVHDGSTVGGVPMMREDANNAALALASAATPSLKFTGDINTGIYSPGADQLAISTGGTSRLAVSTTAVSSTLAVDVPLGAVGTPSLTFTGDLNTGVFSPGADTIALVTGGTNRLHITSGGLVGIGASSPIFLTDILSGTPNTGANVSNPSQLSVTGPNKTLIGGGATFFVNSNSDFAIDNGGSIALSGRNTTSSTNSLVWGVVKGAKENATSTNAAGYLAFASQNHNAGGLVEAMRIDSQQRVGIGITASNANGGILQLSSGITFPATAVAASDANTLDDYEEGTWTPALKFGGNSVSMTGTFAGKYVKVGKVVYYSLSIALTAKGSSTGNTTITGLPFTNASGGNENYSTTIAFMFNGLGLTGPLMPRVDLSSTTLDVFQNGATGYATVSQTNFNNDSQIQAFGFYFI